MRGRDRSTADRNSESCLTWRERGAAIQERRRAGKIYEASVERWDEDGTLEEIEARDSIKAGRRVADHSLTIDLDSQLKAAPASPKCTTE
jgi:hypothetical protein